MTRGPRGQADPKKEEALFEVTARISHCTVKWQNILLANGRNDLNIHFEVVSRKKPSRHLQSECLSPRVFCRTFRTSAPYRHHAMWVLRVCREKSKIWSHSCSRRRHFKHSCPSIHPSFHNLRSHRNMHFCREEDSKTCRIVSMWASVLGLHRSPEKSAEMVENYTSARRARNV